MLYIICNNKNAFRKTSGNNASPQKAFSENIDFLLTSVAKFGSKSGNFFLDYELLCYFVNQGVPFVHPVALCKVENAFVNAKDFSRLVN